jgi:lipopolysaccharide/colanic/teichoic acid biosynthesis glycosyltransferase
MRDDEREPGLREIYDILLRLESQGLLWREEIRPYYSSSDRMATLLRRLFLPALALLALLLFFIVLVLALMVILEGRSWGLW